MVRWEEADTAITMRRPTTNESAMYAFERVKPLMSFAIAAMQMGLEAEMEKEVDLIRLMEAGNMIMPFVGTLGQGLSARKSAFYGCIDQKGLPVCLLPGTPPINTKKREAQVKAQSRITPARRRLRLRGES